MIVIKENERLYATSWQYNSARILTRLAQLITAQGGKVKPLYPAVISDQATWKKPALQRSAALNPLQPSIPKCGNR